MKEKRLLYFSSGSNERCEKQDSQKNRFIDQQSQEVRSEKLSERQKEILKLLEEGLIAPVDARLLWHVEKVSRKNLEGTKDRLLGVFDSEIRRAYAQYKNEEISEEHLHLIPKDDLIGFMESLIEANRSKKERLALSLSKSLSSSVTLRSEYILGKVGYHLGSSSC